MAFTRFAIPKASNETHVRDNAQSLEIQLTAQDLADIDLSIPAATVKTNLSYAVSFPCRARLSRGSRTKMKALVVMMVAVVLFRFATAFAAWCAIGFATA